MAACTVGLQQQHSVTSIPSYKVSQEHLAMTLRLEAIAVQRHYSTASTASFYCIRSKSPSPRPTDEAIKSLQAIEIGLTQWTLQV